MVVGGTSSFPHSEVGLCSDLARATGSNLAPFFSDKVGFVDCVGVFSGGGGDMFGVNTGSGAGVFIGVVSGFTTGSSGFVGIGFGA